jgi:hypothetical protein
VYVFVLYAAMVWFGVYAFRRQWLAWVILLASVPVAFLVVRGTQWLMGTQNTMIWLMAGLYQGLILLIGVVIAVQPRERPARFPCRRCHYDLTGNESGICPECGAHVEVAPPPAVVAK